MTIVVGDEQRFYPEAEALCRDIEATAVPQEHLPEIAGSDALCALTVEVG